MLHKQLTYSVGSSVVAPRGKCDRNVTTCQLVGRWPHIGTLWSRVWGTEQAWATGHLLLAQLAPGQTLARVHFGARWTGVTSNEQEMQTLADDFMALGIVSVTSAHSGAIPNALTAATDAAPPLERWLWWATTQMRPTILGSEHPDVTVWCTDVTVLSEGSQGMVKANIAAGQTLGIYLSWSPWTSTIWGARGNVTGQMWASSLTLT